MTDVADTPENSPTQKGPGRPRRLDWQNAFIENFSLHGIKSRAAKQVGVDPKTIDAERQRDEDFAIRYADAYEEAADNLETFAHRWATTGLEARTVTTSTAPDGKVTTSERVESQVSPTLLIFLLKAMRPKKYRENLKIEQTGPGGGPVKLDLTLAEDVATAARAELERLGATADPD